MDIEEFDVKSIKLEMGSNATDTNTRSTEFSNVYIKEEPIENTSSCDQITNSDTNVKMEIDYSNETETEGTELRDPLQFTVKGTEKEFVPKTCRKKSASECTFQSDSELELVKSRGPPTTKLKDKNGFSWNTTPSQRTSGLNEGTRSKEFLKRILQIDKHVKKEDHYNVMTKDSYDQIIYEIEAAQLAGKKTQKQYRRLNRFRVINICGTRRLVTRKEPMKYYLYVDEIFDVIEAAHVAVGHGGRDRLKNETSRKYANITIEMINTFLSMCERCRSKKSKKKSLVWLLRSEVGRCRVDLIDMQTDHGFNFIMVYQDCSTKFVLLRALRTDSAAEVAHQLTDIFMTFGAPGILHSDNGREFVYSIIEELALFWPECKLVYGKPIQGSQLIDIKNISASWMLDNNTTNWSNGLRFVQFIKNRTHHPGINQSPYKAMFGREPQLGLASTLPLDVIKTIRDEDDLKEALNHNVSIAVTSTQSV